MSFIISTLNSIEFKQINNLLPNYDNTLSKDVAFEGVVNINKLQKFLTSETISTQIKTNYLLTGGDSITATLIDCDGNETNLPVTLIKDFTDTLTGDIAAFYEFYVVGQAATKYKIKVKAVRAGEDDEFRISEPFELVAGSVGFRQTDGVPFQYEFIPNHYKIVAKNVENQFYLYYGTDRASGDPFETSIWISGVLGKPQAGGEVDTYYNLGNLSKLEQISQRIFELKTDDIPDYLALKTQELASLDSFIINDVEYVSTENGEIERFGNYTGGVLTMNFTQAFVEGINSDDQGFIIPTQGDMATIEIKKITNASGSQQLTVSGGYTINQITLVRESGAGTQADVKIGFTPSGNEIMHLESVNDTKIIKNIARNFVNPNDEEASFTAYVDISGVGASATVILQTIINKQ